MPHLSIFGIIGGTVLVIMGLLMGYAVFPPMVNMKVKEVSHLENNKILNSYTFTHLLTRKTLQKFIVISINKFLLFLNVTKKKCLGLSGSNKRTKAQVIIIVKCDCYRFVILYKQHNDIHNIYLVDLQLNYLWIVMLCSKTCIYCICWFYFTFICKTKIDCSILLCKQILLHSLI